MITDSRTGEYITADRAESGVFIWTVPNPLYFKILKHDSRPFLTNHDIIKVQIQFNHNLRRALGLHKCFLTFQVWTGLRPPTGIFLRVFRTQVLKYLDMLGVVSIYNVIRAVYHVLDNVLHKTVDVLATYDIKSNIY
uniref:Replication enhancer n=1 Tax=Tomato leaf curl New Delhi virus TaxID=223347 RepID=A0A3G2KQ67_9GEMI|nr:AC3 [Tomato leaf curl New Delhi virus]WBU87218.1 replication enhancer [Papaya leaf curl Haveri virus]QCB61291.1 replication enhancer protein [Tomato leaf curl New Delhi virus]WOR75545.1 replication enhancer protein [Tomato leaf curl New Delhi virus]WOR75550.1 replication enhancer protein [Tomato leaf curl New Delhi virus]